MERGYAYVKSDLGLCRIAYDDPARWEVVQSDDPEMLEGMLEGVGFDPSRASHHPDLAVRKALFAASCLPGGELVYAENHAGADEAHARLLELGAPV